jgi:hypothetical protein
MRRRTGAFLKQARSKGGCGSVRSGCVLDALQISRRRIGNVGSLSWIFDFGNPHSTAYLQH